MSHKRTIDLAVISDVHLGSYGCHAEELTRYLESINPGTLVINGDLLDIWQFKKYYWPQSHMQVLQAILDLVKKGTTVYYLTGNHDEMLRSYSPFGIGNVHLLDKLVLDIDGKRTWFFHGDVFDVTMNYSRFIAKLGGKGYNLLILLNKLVNLITMRTINRRMSFSRRIKNSVKSAVKYISRFEQTTTHIASENGYKYVVCGHIHRPNIEHFDTPAGRVCYLNSGDWVENLTSLESSQGSWKLLRYIQDHMVCVGQEMAPKAMAPIVGSSCYTLFGAYRFGVRLRAC